MSDLPDLPHLPDFGMPGDAGADLDTDPALAAAVLELEAHAAESGWGQPARLYALVDTALLVQQAPELAARTGLDEASAAGSLTPVEQDELPGGDEFERAVAQVSWPPQVAGCAATLERLVLPPEVDDDIPQDAVEAEAFARAHPLRQEVRMVVGVTRAGASYCALRLRSHDDEKSVVGGSDLVPGLVALLFTTLDEEEPSP
ncbi:PPA1309 family protein [Nocardioides zeae]|uniref:PPA1309 family protein n=1 Tax=Nocardioides imazamoxiresistens TaxID=3231893 RepID=A0ABU3PXY5_9ACTN|nr:PPA1309 family protein [Nocardioides zeae]MDT9593751.1 PPA1309 family protein [Nocardioides zeae]